MHIAHVQYDISSNLIGASHTVTQHATGHCFRYRQKFLLTSGHRSKINTTYKQGDFSSFLFRTQYNNICMNTHRSGERFHKMYRYPECVLLGLYPVTSEKQSPFT
jgi:hypothetical protein